MGEILLDESTHLYKVDGLQMDSVTQILKAEGFINDAFYTAGSADRGTYIHHGCHLDDLNDLDEASFNPEWLGYIEAWRKCKKDEGITIVKNEVRVYSKLWQYVGTLDKIGGIGSEGVIIDIKTGAPKKADKYQLEAYRTAADEMGLGKFHKYACYLKKDGTYKLEPFTNKRDHNEWLSIVTVHNLKKRAA